jgi:hypothetical protein
LEDSDTPHDRASAEREPVDMTGGSTGAHPNRAPGESPPTAASQATGWAPGTTTKPRRATTTRRPQTLTLCNRTPPETNAKVSKIDLNLIYACMYADNDL